MVAQQSTGSQFVVTVELAGPTPETEPESTAALEQWMSAAAAEAAKFGAVELGLLPAQH